MVGEGREEEEVVSELLDVEKHPCRPAYNMVADLPLNLYSTEFEGVAWRMSEYSREHVVRGAQELWGRVAVREAIIRWASTHPPPVPASSYLGCHPRDQLGMVERMAGPYVQEVKAQLDWMTGRRREKNYTPLLKV